MAPKESETCGRCSMTTAIDAGTDGERDPFSDERIEVPEDEMRKAAAPLVAAGRVKHKLNEIATRLTYGR
ncbi:hypothetical protein BRC79_09430 [Halobacteriales archaeon QH_8_67_27]|nr:MAG: hypothetical protein BRC79_09430 [Halobacteriales archaeon QH_8_67_27]